MSTLPANIADQVNSLRDRGYLVLVIAPSKLSGLNRADVCEIESLLIERAESLIEQFGDCENETEPNTGSE